MNITDVDDKIILRGRQQHFFAQFTKKHPRPDESVLAEAQTAFTAYLKKNLPLLPEKISPETYVAASAVYQAVKDGKSLASDGTPPGDAEAKLKMHLRTAETAAEALQKAQQFPDSVDADKFYADTEDIFLPYLDSLYGSTIDASDHSVFTKLTQKYEDLFFEDMRNLNVLDPDKITRVTEYGPQIVKFVERIVKNGFAYATPDGSVYFDIDNFEAAGNPYARLEPWNTGNEALQADGEGALAAKKATNKKNSADFALWKSSKPGEPAWPSPWGPGRPGWHIECSVMASETLGKQMDIHSGGIDLAFPHHDNELAQSEAYWISDDEPCKGHTHEWVKYFLHMGHLSISGAKMVSRLLNLQVS
jgi:cysteinyl-tRNA synthetase